LPAVQVPTWTATLSPSLTPNPTNTDTDTPTATLTPTPAPPTPTPTPAVKPTLVYKASFAKVACRFVPSQGVTVTCGYVSVPEDRTNPRTNTIQLAVVIYHSTSANPAPDPVIFLQGGPGGQAVQLSADDFDILVKPFLDKRDFIAFDQRGTGLSIPALGCDDLENVYKQDIGGQIPASSRDYIYTNAFRSCHGAMVIGGIELNSYTSVASSDDIKDIVNVLGYKQADLYGASYGTRLALVTMRDHPEIVRSAVLDSVVPVEVKLFNEDPIRDNSALQAMFDGCAAEANCDKAYPDLKTVFWDLVDQLQAKPITVSAPQVVGSNNEIIDGSTLIDLIIGLLKYSPTIGFAPQTIYKIKSGDYSSFISMQSSLPYEFEDINLGLYISMTCHEQILATTAQDLQASRNPQDNTSEYISLPFFQDAQALFDACKIWGSVPPVPGENDAVVSDIPALIIEGTYDPATPPIFGKQVAANLSNSYYMEFPNQGHTPTATDTSGCASETMVTFFGNPVQKPDMACLSAIKGVDFALP
jgi:pimeloyl-ACP methyl ester carboxylesterase